jgi:hypothetical protein
MMSILNAEKDYFIIQGLRIVTNSWKKNSMKRIYLAMVLCMYSAFLLQSCKWQASSAAINKSRKLGSLQNLQPSLGAASTPDTTNYDSLLSIVLLQENEIRKMPTTSLAVSLFLKSSFDSSSGCFRVAGKGTYNPELPKTTWRQGMKVAASYDAKRWALYAKQWSDGGHFIFGDKISGEITYSKILAERVQDDTMYVLVSVPIGSVVLK